MATTQFHTVTENPSDLIDALSLANGRYVLHNIGGGWVYVVEADAAIADLDAVKANRRGAIVGPYPGPEFVFRKQGNTGHAYVFCDPGQEVQVAVREWPG